MEAVVLRRMGGDALRRVETVFTQRLGVIGADGQQLDAEPGDGAGAVTGALFGAGSGAWPDLWSTLKPTVVQRAWVLTLVVWGRGTFCGWLCPFGAMQELLSLAAQRLHFKPRRLHTRLDAGLKRIKYGVLAVLLDGTDMSAAWTDTAVEIEPFKTAISLGFDRSWPYVLWALACAGLSVLVFRGYCRYICPLGAALALFGRLRLLAWIPRREACGTPCQTCRHRCEYQAIAPAGQVDYSECFQCLDCAEIYQGDQRCLPLVRQRKRVTGRHIPIHPVAGIATQGLAEIRAQRNVDTRRHPSGWQAE